MIFISPNGLLMQQGGKTILFKIVGLTRVVSLSFLFSFQRAGPAGMHKGFWGEDSG
jgi:bacteriorhodopsin